MKNEDQPIGSRDDLIQISVGFLREVKDMTTGAEMETWLNEKYGEESKLYRDLARLITAGADEDWAEHLEVGSLSSRRSRIPNARSAERRCGDDCVKRGESRGSP